MDTKYRRGLGLAGAAAVAAMAAVGLVHGDDAAAGVPLAGSGDAPASTTYTKPAVGQMKLGGTVTASAVVTR